MIIIINPPNPPGTISNKDMMGGLGQLYPASGSKVPPIDIPYIAACLENNKLSFEVIDCLGLEYAPEALIRRIKEAQKFNKDIIIAIRTSLPTALYDLKIAALLKDKIKVRIVIFGPYVALKPMDFLEKKCVDAIVISEPENIFVDICEKGLENARGVWYKTEKGDVIKNKENEYITNLDALAFPAWQYLPYTQYILPDPQFPSMDYFLPIISSRGCPFSCHYCPYPVLQGSQWRMRSAENVVAEVKYLIDRFKVKNILFRDPEFTLDRQRIVTFCNLLCEQKINCNWRCETRVDTIDPELVSIMAQAGCCGINFGIETYTPEVAQKSGRKLSDKEKMFSVFRACKKEGVHTFCFFIIGLPGQEKGEIFQMIDLAHEIDPDEVQFTFATPYPGTKLCQWAEDNNFILDKNSEHYTGYYPVMRNEFLTRQQLIQMRNFAMHSLERRKKSKDSRIIKLGVLRYGKEVIKGVLFWFEQLFLRR